MLTQFSLGMHTFFGLQSIFSHYLPVIKVFVLRNVIKLLIHNSLALLDIISLKPCTQKTQSKEFVHVMSLKVASGRFFFYFREVFEKCIRYIGKLMVHLREILTFS